MDTPTNRTPNDGSMVGTGIYCMINTLTGEFYIGSAADLHDRQIEHVRDLHKGKHNNHRLLSDYVDETTFRFVCVEKLDRLTDRYLLLLLEQLYIDFYHPYYNIVHNVFVRISPDKSQTWFVIEPDGTEKTIVNLNGYCRERGIASGNMLKVANGIISQHKGYRCRRVGDKTFRFVPRSRNTGSIRSGLKQAKPYLVTHPDGRQEHIIGLNAFCKDHLLRRESVHHAITAGKTRCGYKVVRLPDNSSIPSTVIPRTTADRTVVHSHLPSDMKRID